MNNRFKLLLNRSYYSYTSSMPDNVLPVLRTLCALWEPRCTSARRLVCRHPAAGSVSGLRRSSIR